MDDREYALWAKTYGDTLLRLGAEDFGDASAMAADAATFAVRALRAAGEVLDAPVAQSENPAPPAVSVPLKWKGDMKLPWEQEKEDREARMRRDAGRAAIGSLAELVGRMLSDGEAHMKSSLSGLSDFALRRVLGWLNDYQLEMEGKSGAMLEFNSLSFGETYVALVRAPMPANLTIGSGPSRTIYEQKFLAGLWPVLLAYAAREVLGRRGLTLEEVLA